MAIIIFSLSPHGWIRPINFWAIMGLETNDDCHSSIACFKPHVDSMWTILMDGPREANEEISLSKAISKPSTVGRSREKEQSMGVTLHVFRFLTKKSFVDFQNFQRLGELRIRRGLAILSRLSSIPHSPRSTCCVRVKD